jgi:uncharacterized protein YcfL
MRKSKTVVLVLLGSLALVGCKETKEISTIDMGGFVECVEGGSNCEIPIGQKITSSLMQNHSILQSVTSSASRGGFGSTGSARASVGG